MQDTGFILIAEKNILLLILWLNLIISFSHGLCAFFAEQVGQEILSNLHTDREKIQRARERVSTHTPPAHTHLSILTSACETLEVSQLVNNVGSTQHVLHGMLRKHTNASIHTHTQTHEHGTCCWRIIRLVHMIYQPYYFDKAANVFIH